MKAKKVVRKKAGSLSSFAATWDAWLESSVGIRCKSGQADGIYLQNRLWQAFAAGYESAGLGRGRKK